MPAHFTCPHCGHETVVDDQYLGQTGPCVMCGRTVTVGEASLVPAVSSKRWHVRVLFGLSALLAAVAMVGSAGLVISPVLWRAAEERRKDTCSARMSTIVSTLRNYHQQFGVFPPPVTFDKNGKPRHSWRAYVWSLYNYGEIESPDSNNFAAYRWNEPWDSPGNSEAVNEVTTYMEPIFSCPSDKPGLEQKWTSYLLVTGSGTLFPMGGLKVKSLSDVAGNTVILVECKETGIEYFEPRDLPIALLKSKLNSGKGSISSAHPGGAHVGSIGGDVEFFSEATPFSKLRRRLTVVLPTGRTKSADE